MEQQAPFNGFPRGCVAFLRDLKRHNDKLWFDANRMRYEREVMAPARAFVEAMGQRLHRFSPAVNADPRVNRSLFRLNRDTRFSRDKRPYKTNLGIFFWLGEGKRMECPGYYFHLEPPELLLGVGLYMFTKPQLAEYRASVVHPKHGPALTRTIRRIVALNDYEIGIKHYKKTPRGFDAEHKNAELLLYSGLTGIIRTTIPPELHSPEILSTCEKHFSAMDPLNRWLVEMVQRVEAE